jgi:hypothetical protein
VISFSFKTVHGTIYIIIVLSPNLEPPPQGNLLTYNLIPYNKVRVRVRLGPGLKLGLGLGYGKVRVWVM